MLLNCRHTKVRYTHVGAIILYACFIWLWLSYLQWESGDPYTLWNTEEIYDLPQLPRFTSKERELIDTETCFHFRKDLNKTINRAECNADEVEHVFKNTRVNVTSFKVFRFVSKELNQSVKDHTNYHRVPVTRAEFHGAIQDVWRSMNIDNIHVPNIHHVVHLFIGKNQSTISSPCNFLYYHQLGYLSALWNHRPQIFIMWVDTFPQEASHTCRYWWEFVANVTAIKQVDERSTKVFFIQRSVPSQVFNNFIFNKDDQTDVIRLEALLLYGGIYTDSDSFVVRPFTQFMRRYDFVVGNHSQLEMNNAVILTDRNNRCLRMWYATYRYFDTRNWGFHSMSLPLRLTSLLTHPCHVTHQGFYMFNFDKYSCMRESKRCWSPEEWIPKADGTNKLDVYTYHLYPPIKRLVTSYEAVIGMDCMLGDLCRYILFHDVAIPRQVPHVNCTTPT